MMGPLVLLSEETCVALKSHARALDRIRSGCSLTGSQHKTLSDASKYLDDLVAASRAVQTVGAREAGTRIGKKSRQRVHQLVKARKLRALPKKKGEHLQVLVDSIDEYLHDRLDDSAG